MYVTTQPLTSSVLIAQVGEPPDISEPNTEADAGEQEVYLRRPRLALLLNFRHFPTLKLKTLF